MIRVIVPLEPKGQQRTAGGKHGRFKSKVQRSREDDLRFYLDKKAPKKPFKGPISVEIKAFFKRPKAHYGSKNKVAYLKPEAPFWILSTPDVDNIQKMLFDVMNEIYFEDDRQVCQVKVLKAYSENPRWEIEINPLTAEQDVL